MMLNTQTTKTIYHFNMSSLFEISQDFSLLLSELEDNGGELTPELEKAWEELEQDRDEKIGNCFVAIRKFEADVEAAKEEQRRIKQFRTSREKSIERLKDLIKYSLSLTNERKIDCGVKGKGYLRNSKSVEVSENFENLIPMKYLKRKVEFSPDKKFLKEALEKGEKIDGARIQTNTSFILQKPKKEKE